MIQFAEIEDIIKNKGIYVGIISGNSMFPMLRSRKDTVIIRPFTGRLKKYDIALYKRKNQYILPRIVRVIPDGYIICGDNCVSLESDITDEQVVGKLEGFYRGEQPISINGFVYKLYCRIWVALYPVRCLLKKYKNKMVLWQK